MRIIDYESILQDVYDHFVLREQPPGIIDGRVCYHQGIAGDPLCIDQPCAIGLFDRPHLLDDPRVAIMDVQTLSVCRPDILKAVFNVDRGTREEAGFLAAVQNTHDCHAPEAYRKSRHPLETFRSEMAEGLEAIAADFDLPPVLAF